MDSPLARPNNIGDTNRPLRFGNCEHTSPVDQRFQEELSKLLRYLEAKYRTDIANKMRGFSKEIVYDLRSHWR